jgi:pilus assembly protein CpaE
MSDRVQETTGSSLGPGSQPPTRIAVVGDCDGLIDLLDELRLQSGLNFVETNGNLLGTLNAQVVLQATDGRGWQTELTRIREHTEAPVLLLSSSSSPTMLDEALHEGIEDVLVLPEPVENVAFAIRRAGRAAQRPRAMEPQIDRGLIATVFSPKGGTGKTVISTNLASTLAKHMGRRTLLVDLDLQFGDAAILAGVEPERTLSDLVMAPGELTVEKLAAYVSHHPSGRDILAAPLRPENSELVTDESLVRVLDTARGAYEVIVIDTAPLFHGAVLTAIDVTDLLLVICSPDVASLKNVHLSLRTLSLLSYPSERMRLVLNQAHAGGGLNRSEVEGALGMKISVEIPYDRGVRPALNRGIPAVLADPKGGVAVAMRELAESIAPSSGAAVAKQRRRLGTLRRTT